MSTPRSVVNRLVESGTVSTKTRDTIDRRFHNAEEALEEMWAGLLLCCNQAGLSEKAATRICGGQTHMILERLKMWLLLMTEEMD